MASGTSWTSQTLSTAWMSGPCGWDVSGSRKKMTPSILPSTIRARDLEVPCGPLAIV